MGPMVSKKLNDLQIKEIPPIHVSHQISYDYQGIWKSKKIIKSSRIMKSLDIDKTKAWVYFDGACQGTQL